MTQAFPMLDYFERYLIDHLSNDYENVPPESFDGGFITPDSKSAEDTISNVVNLVKSRVPASLVLGGYDGTKTGNECYPGIDNYIQ